MGQGIQALGGHLGAQTQNIGLSGMASNAMSFDIGETMDSSIATIGDAGGFNADMGNVTGAIGAVGGAMAFGQDMAAEINQYKDLKFRGSDTMINGIPSYSGVSSLRQQAIAVDREGAGKGLIGKGAMAGAQLGAAAGSFVGPWGQAIGAAAGAITGTITGIFGKSKAQKEAEKAEERGYQKFFKQQEGYNEDVEEYFEDVDENRAEAQEERNYSKRIHGMQVNDPFATMI